MPSGKALFSTSRFGNPPENAYEPSLFTRTLPGHRLRLLLAVSARIGDAGRELAGWGADNYGNAVLMESDMEDVHRNAPDRFGFWVSTLTALITAGTFVVAVLTPPKSGPFCVENCLGYPYTDFVAYIPRDFLWMYPALFVAPLFVVLLAAMHERALPGRRHFSRIAMAFGIMAATTLTADYFIQLRFVQPAVLKGELDGLAPWTQYNPHGVFIALEEAGYALMGAAFLFAGLALSTETRLVRTVRIIFLTGFASVTTAFVALSGMYGFDVEYRFEVAAITIDWTVLIVTGTLLAIALRTQSRGSSR